MNDLLQDLGGRNAQRKMTKKIRQISGGYQADIRGYPRDIQFSGYRTDIKWISYVQNSPGVDYLDIIFWVGCCCQTTDTPHRVFHIGS